MAKKYKATVIFDGKEVSFESDILPFSDNCRKVKKPKNRPIQTKEYGTWKVKKHTREEAREFFNKINL